MTPGNEPGPAGEAQAPLSPLAALLDAWRRDWEEKLKELHGVKVEFRKYREGQDREIQNFLTSLIDVVDSFDRTAAVFEDALNEEDKKALKVLKSFKLLRKQIFLALGRFGVTPMEIGEEFVSGLHKAADVVPVGENLPDGRIVRVEKEGYYWNHRILRPAEVVVAAREAQDEISDNAPDQEG